MMEAIGRRKKITIIYCLLASYVKRDIEILKTKYDVVEIYSRNIRRNPRSFLSIAKHVPSSDLILGWFADYPTLWAIMIAKIFRRKSIVIVVGYEVAKEPKFGYGRQLRNSGKHIVRWTVNLANEIIAVSNFSREEAINNLQLDPNKIRTVYHGFPIPRAQTDAHKEPLVLTVAFVIRMALKKKGLETFVRSAAYLPKTPFVVLGDWIDDTISYLKEIASSNVQFIQVKSGGSRLLEDYYKKAKVYVQASLHESFGCSLAEAMLWQCIPVVTNRGALPEVIGDTGFYVPPNDPEKLASQITVALKSEKGFKARQRIIEKFHIENRKRTLLRIVEELIGN